MKKALVIGINDYPYIPLSGCINDASAFKSIIETNGDGSPNFDAKLVTDIKLKSDLKGLIKILFSGACDTALLYFSGHGYASDTGTYVVTPDWREDDEGVSMDEILTLANESKATDRIIILDCCHAGRFGSYRGLGGDKTNISEGVSILAASKPDESAVEMDGHGVFTNLLIDALRGGASDIEGRITTGSIYAYIDQALGAWDQRPIFKTNISRFNPLRTVSPKVSAEILRRLVEFFPTPEDHFLLNPSFEDTNSISVEHKVIEPYAKPENVAVFKQLQKMQSLGLIVPVDAEFMYFAAMDSKACRLTALGYHYWRLAKEKRV